MSGSGIEVYLDLSQDLPGEMAGKYDVCFNHTTLEHIFDFRKAFSSICAMSRDIVFIVVPFAQALHESESFKDYWRFTPSGIRYLFEENEMSVVYEASSPHKNAGIYIIMIASKYPDKWEGILPPFEPLKKAGDWIGNSFMNRIAGLLKDASGRK
jgi:hypothetical protein